MSDNQLQYAGFWSRTGAAVIDTLLLLLVTTPVLVNIYGWSYFGPTNTKLIAGPADFLISWVLPAVLVVVFWVNVQATPGKMAVSARIVDAKTGMPASTGQLVGRYLGYFVATVPLGLGIIWVAFDKRKQGWHDKLAGTVVVKKPEPVRFNKF